MTKKNSGLAKNQVIRIHPTDRQDLNIIKKEIKMHRRNKEGDVIHQLIAMYKSKRIGDSTFLLKTPDPIDPSLFQTTLDDYKGLLNEQVVLTQNWKRRFEKVCQAHNVNPVDYMRL